MFSLGSRKNQEKVRRFMSRFINQGSMARIKVPDQGRIENRVDMNVGVWVAPMLNRRPDVDRAFRAITKNFTTSGVGLFVDHDVPFESVLVRLVSEDQAMFLRCDVVDSTSLGSNFYLIGLKVDDIVPSSDFSELEKLENLLNEYQTVE